MRILFVGCVESSYILLQSLLEHKKEIVGVITKKEAGLNADYKDLSVLCLNYGIDYKYISNINDEEVIRYVREKSRYNILFWMVSNNKERTIGNNTDGSDRISPGSIAK